MLIPNPLEDKLLAYIATLCIDKTVDRTQAEKELIIEIAKELSSLLYD